MAVLELSDDERRVLRAIAALQTDGEVQTVHAIALRMRASYTPVHRTVNRLFTAGLVTPDLRLTDDGRRAAAPA